MTKAFTLIEILAVVAIVAVLSTIVLSVGKGVSARQAITRAKGDMAAIVGGLELYKAQYGDYLCLTTSVPNTIGDGRAPQSSEIALTKAMMGDYAAQYIVGRTQVYDFEATSSLSTRGALVDPTGFRYMQGTGTSSAYTPTKIYNTTSSINIVFSDPWNNPYMYRYKVPVTGTQGSTNIWRSDWINPSYLLISMGPDAVIQTNRSVTGERNITNDMNNNGIIPDDYRTSSNALMNMDNIIWGHAD